jgi:transposase
MSTRRERMIDVPWAVPSNGFTLVIEAFVLELATAMPVERIGALIGEYDTRLWRIVQRYVKETRNKAGYSTVHTVEVVETSNKKKHNYVSIFVNMDESRVVLAVEGNDSGVFTSF